MTDRRTVLKTFALLPLAGCATTQPTAPAPTTTTSAPPVRHDALFELEKKFDARLGVYALSNSGRTIEHRADERFAFCSTFKGLAAAAILHRNPMTHLDTVVTYTEADLMKSSAITKQHVQTGMKLRDLCDAAVCYSDGTAGNLLLRDVGGPAELTRYLRELGDTETRMDRVEPAITEATPGDPRDTATPRSLGTDYQRLVLGDALPQDKRDFLTDLLERSVTGAKRVRAGVPQGSRVASKTGTGDYGTLNDIAVVWPPGREPILVALMSSRSAADAKYDEALLAEAAAYVVKTLT
ncbi:class A beta-lactamase [Lentzea aerocolonigenes]|uniref:class A beta-lactamase n=1 Tax=Lentzea aerocolonigenes TaxID=68170 RepID=UPI0004C356FC|nr:class A beta-lactamase [Lentzea aerocolonigenes]MCP2245386.1 beta-lactamase class A [Lentzea aerocolonigenes]